MLSCKHLFNVLNFNSYYVLRLSLRENQNINQFNEKILVRVEYFLIKSNNNIILENLYKSCLNDSFNKNLIKTVGNELISEGNFGLESSRYIVNQTGFVLERRDCIGNFNDKFNVNIMKDLRIDLELHNVWEMYNFFHSYYSNYNILESILSLKTSGGERQESQIVQNKVSVDANIEVIETQDKIKEENLIEDIFSLIDSITLKNSLIHHIFNYYQYVEAGKDENNTINLPEIFMNSFGIDGYYLNNLILTNNQIIDMDKVNHYTLNILGMLMEKKYTENKICLMSLCYILCIYCIRFFYEFYPDYVLKNINKILVDPASQESMLNMLIEKNKLFSNFKGKIKFKVVTAKNLKIENNEVDNQIKQLSEKYSYLKSISEKEFIERVFSEIQPSTSAVPNIKLSKKKVLNIRKLAQKSNTNNQNINDLIQITDQFNEYYLLEYIINQKDNKITTHCYNLILKYIKDPSILLIDDNTLIKDKKIPNTVIKLFDLLCNTILNNNIIKEDNVNTFNYYLILKENIPNFDKLSYNVILYLIFQVIIPFSNDMYGNEIFEDYLLV